MNTKIPTLINIISVSVAVIAAGITIWQTMEAKTASRDAFKFALSSERLESCLKMNGLISQASMDAMFHDLMKKPYKENQRFVQVVGALHFFTEEVSNFKQMTPGDSSESLWKDTMEFQIYLKDMLVDGGDYLTRKEIRKYLSKIRKKQIDICNKMFSPKDGF